MKYTPKKVVSKSGENRFTVNFPDDVLAAVEVAREEDRRTKNAEILYLVELGLRRREADLQREDK